MNGVPTILFNLLHHPDSDKYDLKGLKFISGGAALPRGLLEEALRRGIVVIQGFGMTETAPVLTLAVEKPNMKNWSPEKKMEYTALSIGLPLPFVDIKVVDLNDKELPWDGKSMGELVVRAPWVAREYINDPEKTGHAWRNKWFHTDDLVTITPDGYVWVMDRAKDVIKSGGEWISSVKLEDLISTHPAVAEVAVIGVPHPKWGERPVAIVVPKQGMSITEDEVKKHLMKYVESGVITKWWVPDKVIVSTVELPKTSTGKADKKVLKDRYSNALSNP